MSWRKESILVLVEAAPNWSDKYGSYLVCTGGVTESNQWRRLYPMPLDFIAGKIHRWNTIEVNTTEPEHDPRSESRKIDPSSIVVCGSLDKNEHRALLNKLAERSLDVAIGERRSIILIKPEIVNFHLVDRKDKPVQLTLNGEVFKEQPYRDVGLYYRWNCPERCAVCSKHPHHMECFDWGAGILWSRYKADRKVAEEKITEMCYDNMKERFDAWFALGTHSRRPFSKWMIVSLFWMKKAS